MRVFVAGFAYWVVCSAVLYANQGFRLMVRGATNPSVTYTLDAGAAEKATRVGENVYRIRDLNGAGKVRFDFEATDGSSAVYSGEFALPDAEVQMAAVTLRAGGRVHLAFSDTSTLLRDSDPLFGASAALPTCPSGVYCQLPDQVGHGSVGTLAAISDTATGDVASESLQAHEAASITSICFWGVYVDFSPVADCGPGANEFKVTYYDDLNGLPNAVIGGPFVGPADNVFDTGNDIVVAGGSLVIDSWQFELSHAPVPLDLWDRVHIEIQNNSGAGTPCLWLWETAPPPDGRSIQNGAYVDYDLAVCVDISAGAPPVHGSPANDLCVGAFALPVPAFTFGSTGFASTDTAPFCDTSVTSPGVWYSVVGTGNTMTTSLCNAFATYDTKLSVYCGDCADPTSLTCVVGNDDFCGSQSAVSWCSQVGATYHVLVHGFGGESGLFGLAVTDDGVACSGAVDCMPVGACCIDVGGGQIDCQVVTEAECASRAGLFQGGGSVCSRKEYFDFACTQGFEDISGIGSALSLGDDDGVLLPIGFDFGFFEQRHSTVAVCSNGYLTFGTALQNFSNRAFPHGSDPNGTIAPLWDDLDPSSGGQVYAGTFGVAPNRAFIAQWDAVPQFGHTDANTFQAILFENSNRISFRYLNITPEAFSGDYSVGVENVDGSRGTALDASTIFNGDCILLIPDTIPGDCAMVLLMDVRPGHCPNTVLPNSNGVVTVALPGTDAMNPSNATLVDGSAQLELAGGSAPVQAYRATTGSLTYAVSDATAGCGASGPDGIDDWVMQFSAASMSDAFGLGQLGPGATVQVRLSGQMTQGANTQSFAAYDDVTVASVPTQATCVSIVSRMRGHFTPTSEDVVGDSGAFGGQVAVRYVQPGSSFAVTAGPMTEHPELRWFGWYLDGQFLTSNATANIVVGTDNLSLTPRYGREGSLQTRVDHQGSAPPRSTAK